MRFSDLSNGTAHPTCDVSEFREFMPAEEIVGPFKVWELSDDRGWIHDFHWKRPTHTLNPVGFHEVSDLIVTRPGGTILSTPLGYNCATGLDNARSIPESDDYFLSSSKNKIILTEKTIVADGVSLGIWGHWLVDYLPRFGLTRSIFGHEFANLKILLPAYAPRWIFEFLLIACGANEDSIVTYTPDNDIVLCKNAILPSYCYTQEFSFHSYMKRFYRSFSPAAQDNARTRKILVSRSNHAPGNRRFPNQGFFETAAREKGYEIVAPEALSIEEQISIFSEAAIIIGEYGSGMHNALFAAEGTVVGCLGFWNAVQLHIGYLMEQTNVFLTKGCVWPTPENNEFLLDCSEPDLLSFFEKVESLAVRGLTPQVL